MSSARSDGPEFVKSSSSGWRFFFPPMPPPPMNVGGEDGVSTVGEGRIEGNVEVVVVIWERVPVRAGDVESSKAERVDVANASVAVVEVGLLAWGARVGWKGRGRARPGCQIWLQVCGIWI